MKLRLVVLLVVALAPALAAQSTVQRTHRADVHRAWLGFQAANPGQWHADWCEATGTPRAVWGPGLPLPSGPVATVAGARRHGDRLLRDHSELLGLGASSFVPDIAQKVQRVFVLVYRQRFRGLPVIGGRADVRVHDVGTVSLFGAEAVPVPADLPTVPHFSPADARALAFAALELSPPGGPELRPRGPMLVVWADTSLAMPTPVRLAWEVSIDRLEERKVGVAYVDARNGRLLQYRNELYESTFAGAEHSPAAAVDTPAAPHVEVSHGQATARTNVIGNVRAWVNLSTDPNAATVNIPLRGVRVQISGGNSAFTDVNGDFDIPHPGTTQVTLTISLGGARRLAALTSAQGAPISLSVPATPGVPANVQISTPSASQFERAQTTCYHFVDSVNEYCRGIIGSLPAATDSVTARVNIASTCNAFYTGNTINFYAVGGGCVNTAYATVVEHEWGHGLDDRYGGISQTDGLSEGWGDVIAMYHTGQPVIGQGFSGPGTIIRTGLNVLTYPAGGGVHTQGQTWMGWSWDVRLNLIRTLGQAAGIARAEDLVIGSIVADATNQPTAVREVFVLDDDDGNLNNGTPNCNPLARACIKRSLPNPTPCTGSQVPGIYNTFGVGCLGTGTVPAVCLRVNDTFSNQGAATRANLIYAIRFTPTTNLNINGFELNTSFPGGTTVPVFLYDESAGQPANRVATGTMSVGPTLAWYNGAFTAPFVATANQNYYIAFQNGVTPIAASTVNGGPNTPYFRNDGAGGTWNGPLGGFSWGFRIRCVSTTTAVPVLTNAGFPEINTPFGVDLSLAVANSNAVLFFGVSNTSWGAFGLPLPLDPFGAPGCSVLASGDISVPVTVGPTGSGAFSFTIPNDLGLVGAIFHNQFLVQDAAANPLGWVVTRGGTGKIGRP